MPTLFHINEVVNFAIEREQQSYDLYKQLAETVDHQRLKETFQVLMGEEQQHKEHYTALLSEVDSKQTPGVTPGEEYNDYMLNLIETARTVKSLHVTAENIEEALNYAIEREKDAILFYVGLENYVPEKDRPVIQGIIREEGSHIVKLNKLRRELL